MTIELTDGSRMSEACYDRECDDDNACFLPECVCDCHEHEQWSGAYGWVDNDWAGAE